MGYRFVFTNWFNRNLKQLAKRNPKLRTDLENFLSTFDAENHPIIPHTGGARKARMKVTGRGKRGSYRVVYYYATDKAVWLLTVYDKVRQENLSPVEQKRIQDLIQTIKSMF